MDDERPRSRISSLDDLLAIPVSFLLTFMAIVCLLSGSTVNGDPLWDNVPQNQVLHEVPHIQAARQRHENNLAAERGEALPFPNAPNMPRLRQQVEENMEAILHGILLPWPVYDDAGFSPDVVPTLEQAALRRLQQQRRIPGDLERAHLHAARPAAAEELVKNNAPPRVPRNVGPDTPAWILALFPDDQPAGQDNEESKPACPICLDELPARVSIAEPCKHRFCVPCLEDWMAHLEKTRQSVRCPICSRDIRSIGNNGELGNRLWGLLRRN